MKDWKAVVKTVSPLLGSALGGPLGGAAAKLISEGLLAKSDATDTEIATALLDPDNLVRLKSIEKDFEVRMKELDVDVKKLSVEDRKSARDLAKVVGIEPHVVLSFVFICGFFAVLWLLFVSGVSLDPGIEKLALVLVGSLGANVTSVVKFWFGGSPNDQRNADNMYNSIPREQLKK